MKVYQLKLSDYVLDPVFKTRKGAMLFKSKYQNRKIEIEEKIIDSDYKEDYIYRILMEEKEGVTLLEMLFTNLESAKKHMEENLQNNARVVKEYFSSEAHFHLDFYEV